MRLLLIVLTVRLAAFACSAQAADPVKVPPGVMRTVRYADWGFQIQVPRSAVKHTTSSQGETGLSEIYVSPDLVYVVRVTPTPSNALASTTIEQSIQAAVKAATGASTRWELDSRQGDLFKGLSRPLKLEELAEKEAALIRQSLGDAEGFQSVSMAPLGDEAAPILTIGVIGPADRSGEIENTAKYLAYTVRRIDRATAPESHLEPSAPLAGPSDRPGPVAKPRTKPAQVKHALKKGDIELLGKVESLDKPRNTMVMLVTRIVMPGLKPIALDPVRRKTVLYKSLPPGIEPQTRVRIIGKNTGVGNPMTADIIEAIESNTPPKLQENQE